MSKAPELSEIFIVQDIELKPVSQLETYVNNPKDHPEDQIETIAHLIRNFGFLVPIVEKGNTIAAGEGRLLAAKLLGMEVVPTIQAEHLTDDQLRAFRIADNAAARTGWWEEGLRLEVQGLQSLGVDLSLTGLQPAELEIYKKPLTPPLRPGAGGGLEGDEPPGSDWLDDLVEKWQTTQGQLWEIPSKQLKGMAHRIACGDCRDPALLEALMGKEKAEMIFTDPPYGVDSLGHGLNGARDIHFLLRDPGLRCSCRPAEQPGKTLVGHGQAGRIVKEVHIQPESAVLLEIDQLIQDQVHIFRLTVRRQAHQLVLTRVHTETGVIGKGRVQHAQRVREIQFPLRYQLVTITQPNRRGRPLPHAVQAQYGGLLERARVERRCGMRLVMLGKHQLRQILFLDTAQRRQFSLQRGLEIELLLQPHRHRRNK